jgi:hypothetical protein
MVTYYQTIQSLEYITSECNIVRIYPIKLVLADLDNYNEVANKDIPSLSKFQQ